MTNTCGQCVSTKIEIWTENVIISKASHWLIYIISYEFDFSNTSNLFLESTSNKQGYFHAQAFDGVQTHD